MIEGREIAWFSLLFPSRENHAISHDGSVMVRVNDREKEREQKEDEETIILLSYERGN